MPNDYTAHPVVADVVALLTTGGVYDAAWNLGVQGALDSAIGQWQTDTEHKPFLSSGQTQIRTFAAPRNSVVLFLQKGLISLESLTVTGHGGSPQSDSSTLSENDDFVLEPIGADGDNQPFTRIRFFHRLSGVISIEGVWGYALAYPPNAFAAIVRWAALFLAPDIALRIRRDGEKTDAPLKAKEAGTMRMEYQTQAADKLTNLESQKADWQRFYSQQVGLYQLV